VEKKAPRGLSRPKRPTAKPQLEQVAAQARRPPLSGGWRRIRHRGRGAKLGARAPVPAQQPQAVPWKRPLKRTRDLIIGSAVHDHQASNPGSDSRLRRQE